MSLAQNFLANILENVSGAFDADFAAQNRIFILDGQNALVVHVHIRLYYRLPQRGAVAIADRAEGIRRSSQIAFVERELQRAVFRAVFRKDYRVLHVRVKKSALLAKEVNYFHRIAALPEEVA